MTDAKRRIFVKKGVAEADPERLTVLAQTAIDVEEFDSRHIADELKVAEAELAEAQDDQSKLLAETLVDQLKRLQAKAA
jgi:F-type H+-transporting ATPase subunit epsilon